MKVRSKPGFRTLDRVEDPPDDDPLYYEHRTLTEDKIYTVIGIEADSLRLVDDAGEPILFPPEIFDVVDPAEPSDWITAYGEEGERYAYPPGIGGPGYFEAWHDRDPEVRRRFADFLRTLPSRAGPPG